MTWANKSISGKLIIISALCTVLLLAAVSTSLWTSWNEIKILGRAEANKNYADQIVQIDKAVSGTEKIIIPLLLAIFVIVTITLIMMVRLTYKAYVVPANLLAKDVDKLAEGDILSPVTAKGLDEIGEIASRIERFRSNISSRIASMESQISMNINHQSEAAEATAKAVDEIDQSIAEATEIAGNANRVSRQALEHTSRCNISLSGLMGEISVTETAVEEISDTVSEFVHSTQTIAEITQQVKSVAAQTNLVALNAAIEAARAGEEGRGFAVVSAEVRRLAQISAQSANQIEKVTVALGEQSAQVELALQNGLNSLKATEEFLEEVVTVLSDVNQAVAQTTESVNNMVHASMEQKHTLHEIARQVTQMSENNQRAAIEDSVRGASNSEPSNVVRLVPRRIA